MPTLSITRQTLAEQPVVCVRLRAARHELATAIGEGLGKAFPYAQMTGHAIAGRPFTRCLSNGPGLLTIEPGIPLSAPAPGEGDVQAGVLPAGPAVVALHGGPYSAPFLRASAIRRSASARFSCTMNQC